MVTFWSSVPPRAFLLCTLGALLVPVIGRAQLRQEILVPGSTASLARVLGFDPAPERSRFMLEIIRALYDQPQGVNAETDETLESFHGYLDALTELEAAAHSAGGTAELSLADVSERKSRNELEKVLELLGLDLRKRKGVYRVELDRGGDATTRREFLSEVGVEASAIARQLNAGGTASFEVPYETVPLPLPPPVWAEVVFGERVPKHALFRAIMSDRKAALLYYGLCAVDDETLAYLVSHPELLGRLYRNHAAIFAVFGRSIHVDEGVIQIPGDARARALWTDLVDARLNEPERFIRRLLGGDSGRLAFFYDTIIHLDEPYASFALGLYLDGHLERRDRFRDLYDAFAGVEEGVNLKQLPFKRRAFDAALLLREVTLDGDGRLGSPNWYDLWRKAYGGSDLPDRPEDELEKLDPGDVVDIAWLVERVCHRMPGTRRERFEMFLFAQRVFPDGSLEEAPEILLALRGFVRHRTLMLTLERMGLTSPALYAAAAKRAAELSDIGDDRRATIALAQFQGALALLDRARFQRILDVEQAHGLVLSLVVLELDDERYHGAIAGWLDRVLVPTFRSLSGAGPDASEDDVVMLALAGAPSESATTISWEGMDLRLSFRESEYQRLVEMRGAQSRNDLASILAFWRLTQETAAATTLDDLRTRSHEIDASSAMLSAVEQVGVDYAASPTDVDKVLRQSVRRLRKLKNQVDVRKLARAIAPLVELSDELLADVLRSYVYAIHLGRVGGPILITLKLAPRHDFGLTDPVGERRKQIPWQLATEISNKKTPWHVRGSLLAMDLGLARLRLRRLVGSPPQRAPTMISTDRETFSQVVVLMNPLTLREADRDTIASAMRLGRARVERLVSDPDDVDAAALDARLSEWRRYALPWVLANDPEEAARYFSLTELFWLGRGALSFDQAHTLDDWGSVAIPATGCYCLRFPTPGPWEDVAGRLAHGQLAGRMPDLSLLVAEQLWEWELPASLAPAILSYLVLDFIEGARPLFIDDWHTLAHHALTFPRERIEDYVSSLAADGPLSLSASGLNEDENP